MSTPRIIVFSHPLLWEDHKAFLRVMEEVRSKMRFVLLYTTASSVPPDQANVVPLSVFDVDKVEGTFLFAEQDGDVWYGISRKEVGDVIDAGKTPFVIVPPSLAGIMEEVMGHMFTVVALTSSQKVPDEVFALAG